MQEKEQRLKEQRVSRAIQQQLMGLEGKIGVVVQFLGQPIRCEDNSNDGGMSMESNPMPNFYEIEDDEMPMADPFAGYTDMGMHFDGLSRGMHLEIKYTETDKDLSVRYKGRIVYLEVGGELECYVPHPEWEDMIEKLYRVARKKQVVYNKLRGQEEEDEQKQAKQDFISRLAKLWGFK